MNTTLSFYTANSEFCDYLRRYDYRVPYTMDNKKTRPFIGVLLKVNDINYYAPLSSPKEKHLKMREQFDFLKINNGEWGVINFNNMIPISNEFLIQIKPKEFTSGADEQSYKNLLENQLSWCNQNKDIIIKKAVRLYKVVTTKQGNKNLINRCCDFKLLEQKAQEYIQAQEKGQKQSLSDKIKSAQEKANKHNAEKSKKIPTQKREQEK